jgi:hypothetical protein
MSSSSYLYGRQAQEAREWGHQGEPQRGGVPDYSKGYSTLQSRATLDARGGGHQSGAIDQHALALALESSLRTFSPSPAHPPSGEQVHAESHVRPTKANPDVTAQWTHVVTGQHIHFVLTTINADRAPVVLRVEEMPQQSLGLGGGGSRFQGFGQVGKQPQF